MRDIHFNPKGIEPRRDVPNDPTNTLSASKAGNYVPDMLDVTEEIMLGAIRNFLEALKKYTHIDLTGFLDVLEAPFDMLRAVLEGQGNWGALLGGLQLPNVSGLIKLILNPIGLINKYIPALIPVTSIVTKGVNLLTNGLFETVHAITGGGPWGWTSAFKTGKSKGSAHVIHDGTDNMLYSEPPLDVDPGQQLEVSQGIRWAALNTVPGVAFELGVATYDATGTPLGEVAVAQISNPLLNSISDPDADDNGFVFFSAGWVVPPGVEQIRETLRVTAACTQGESWWSESTLEKVSTPPLFQALDRLTGKVDAEWLINLINIPRLAAERIIGIGAATIVDTLQDTWDKLWGGFKRIFGGSGKSAADVANAANDAANNALTAIEVGEWNNALLGIRYNKSIMSGIDETEESNFDIATLLNGTSQPPTIPVTSAAVPLAFWRASETAKKGFISWFGKDHANITALYIDIYKVDQDAGDLVLLHSSTNRIGTITDEWGYNIYNLPVLDRIDVIPGMVLAVGWRVVGTGTHSIAGQIGGWLPAHPTIHPKKPSATRSGVGTMELNSLVYSGGVPWFGIGIVVGDQPIDYHAPRFTNLVEPGPESFVIEEWVTAIDVVMLGGGGGGHGGNPFGAGFGSGGQAGEWFAETLYRGIDFPEGTTELDFIVAAGGGPGPYNNPGGDGQSTQRLAISGGKGGVIAEGGEHGLYAIATHNQGHPAAGYSPGNFVYQGTTYQGGGTAPVYPGGNGSWGSPAGGGGGGGSGGVFGVAFQGGGGARGSVWITARQGDPP